MSAVNRAFSSVVSELSSVRMRPAAMPKETKYCLTIAASLGPEPHDERPVRHVADTICDLWGDGLRWDTVDQSGPSEVPALRIDSTKARERLGWRPHWDLADALAATVSWFARYREGEDGEATVDQVRAYLAGAPPPSR